MTKEQIEVNNYALNNLIFSPQGPLVAESAYVVSVFPVLEDEIGQFGSELPYAFNQEYPYGGLIRIKIPAAQRGKNIWRKIYPEKLLNPIPNPPVELLEKERLKAAGEWYNLDKIEPLSNSREWGHVVLEVGPAYQWSIDPRNEMRLPLTITARDLAFEGLVKPNLSVLGPRGTIGLGWTPDKDKIPALVEQLKAQQEISFEGLVQEAHILDRSRKSDRINRLHRLAFDWLNLNPATAPWRHPTLSMVQKNCLLCGIGIQKNAISCPNCGLLPLRYLEAIEAGLDLQIPEGDVILAQMAKISSKKKGK
jgi:hypothetical protein